MKIWTVLIDDSEGARCMAFPDQRSAEAEAATTVAIWWDEEFGKAKIPPTWRDALESLQNLHGFFDSVSVEEHDLTPPSPPNAAAYRSAAQKRAREGEIEVDDNAVVSLGDDPGAYVQAWLWISDSEAGLSTEDDE